MAESAPPFVGIKFCQECELEHINSDIVSDPTLPRTYDHNCPRCDYNVAAFFQSQSVHSDNMQLYYVCCASSCGYKWIE